MTRSKTSAKHLPKARNAIVDKRPRRVAVRKPSKRKILKDLEGTDTGFLTHPRGGFEGTYRNVF